MQAIHVFETKVQISELRCPRKVHLSNGATRVCNKKLAEPNRKGQIAGIFFCPRCGNRVEL